MHFQRATHDVFSACSITWCNTRTHRIGFYSYQKLRTNREGDGGTRGRGDHDEETGPGPLRQLEAGDGRHRALRRGDRMHGLCHHITALGM